METDNVQTQSGSVSRFVDVDHSDNPQGHVDYLDFVAATTSYKRESIAALALRPGDCVLTLAAAQATTFGSWRHSLGHTAVSWVSIRAKP